MKKNIKDRIKSPFNLIVLGFTLHSIGGALRALSSSNMPMIVLGILAWYFIIKGFSKIKFSLRENGIRGIYKFLLFFYILICLVMIIRGYLIDYNFQWISTAGMLNYHFLEKYYLLPYFMPLICFIPWKYYKLDRYCKYSSWIGLLSVIILLLFWNKIVEASVAAMMGRDVATADSGRDFRFYSSFSIAILLVAYIKPRTWKWNILGFLSLFLINLIAARRGSALMTSILFVAALYMWAKYKQKKIGLISKVVVVAVICGGVYFILNSSLFDYLFERGLEDTRSGVDEALKSQMTDWQLWFGKGLNGRYYYPLLEDDFLNGWRYGSETGFYNIVLKGGYLMAFTYILLLFIPAYKGMFKSSNMLCKAGGFFILLSLLELYPFGWLEFSPKFLIIWMMVALCSNPQIRCMNDSQIKQQFFQ